MFDPEISEEDMNAIMSILDDDETHINSNPENEDEDLMKVIQESLKLAQPIPKISEKFEPKEIVLPKIEKSGKVENLFDESNKRMYYGSKYTDNIENLITSSSESKISIRINFPNSNLRMLHMEIDPKIKFFNFLDYIRSKFEIKNGNITLSIGPMKWFDNDIEFNKKSIEEIGFKNRSSILLQISQ